MRPLRAFVTGWGMVCAAGRNPSEVTQALFTTETRLTPLSVFSAALPPPPVGQIFGIDSEPTRTHHMARIAARQAVDPAGPPEAIVLGVATGGVVSLEEALMRRDQNADDFRRGAGPVVEALAVELGCQGPVWSISTACSSSAAALKVGLDLIRTGRYVRVLVCGAESLSRLTVYGFHFLQLLDPQGARPFDRDRAGMSLGEGAAALMLTGADQPPGGALAELCGGGLTCDAHHPIAPHPEGVGAAAAMRAALVDAGLTPDQVDYINLHGTGTLDNDSAEAAAVRAVFGDRVPPSSSLKGLVGHTTAAAGVVEAAASVAALKHGFIPANTGLTQADPQLTIEPTPVPIKAPIQVALSNSFGFGGNNAAVVLGRPDRPDVPPPRTKHFADLAVLGAGCLTGAGRTDDTWEALNHDRPVVGRPSDEAVGRGLGPRVLRRLKRLPRLALGLAHEALERAGGEARPDAVFFGTGWGTLSETHSFLTQLFESNEKLSSPVDFMYSVHNAPAGQVALNHKATGPNLTVWGGNHTFEQALHLAALAPVDHGPALVIGADEFLDSLTPLSDPDGYRRTGPADGGGALLVRPADGRGQPGARVRPLFFEVGLDNPDGPGRLLDAIRADGAADRAGLILSGRPAAEAELVRRQWSSLQARWSPDAPMIDYRERLGDFNASAAVAFALAAVAVQTGRWPGLEVSGGLRSILMLSFGRNLAGFEIKSGP